MSENGVVHPVPRFTPEQEAARRAAYEAELAQWTGELPLAQGRAEAFADAERAGLVPATPEPEPEFLTRYVPVTGYEDGAVAMTPDGQWKVERIPNPKYRPPSQTAPAVYAVPPEQFAVRDPSPSLQVHSPHDADLTPPPMRSRSHNVPMRSVPLALLLQRMVDSHFDVVDVKTDPTDGLFAGEILVILKLKG